ncbi:hypothetical protein FRC08_002069 [Ceratobasidium sp. 394]|nr:hypothetical protein FRC08_002069 [Ceratobasidium sp. 394]
MSLPPWDQETFSFGWEPWTACSIPQCSTLDIKFSSDLVTIPNPPAAPPYTVHVYQGGYAPLALPVGNTGQKGTYPWTVNLQLNSTFMVTMSDSAGYTGGTSHRCTIIPGNSSCLPGAATLQPMSLNFTRSGGSQCGNVNIVVNNGVSPFQVEIIPEYRQQKTLHFATNSFGFVLDLPASLPYFIVVTDAASNSAVEGILAVGSSSDNSCLNAAPTMTVGMFTSIFSGSGVVMPSTTLTGASTATSVTVSGGQSGSSNSSTTSIGGIIGGAVAGVIAIIAILLLLWWLLCRRQRKRREATATNEQASQGGSMPDMGYVSPWYSSYAHQHGYGGAPETQGSNTRYIGGTFAPPGAAATGRFYDPYAGSSLVNYNEVTTHAPQARPSLLGVRNSAEGNPPWGTDWKERAVSPSSDGRGSRMQPWERTTSPPRSLTSTVPPPYEPTSNSQELHHD